MMKKISRMLSALMIVLCVFILSACGSSSSGGTNPVGTYELTAASAEEDGSAAEQFEMMKESGLIATLDLKDDGTGLLNMFGTNISVTWDKDAKTIKVYDQDMEYTIAGDTFTFTWDGTKLEFTKTE